MKRGIRLYNMIFPVWMLWLFPPAWLVILPGNLLLDGLVLLLSLAALGCAEKRSRMRSLLLPFWLCGFLADFAGLVWMYLGVFLSKLSGGWTLSAVALSGVCIYFLDRAVLKGELAPPPQREQRIIALSMAVATAPWTFFCSLS